MFNDIDFNKDVIEILSDMTENIQIAENIRKEINSTKKIMYSNKTDYDDIYDIDREESIEETETNENIDKEFDDRIEYFLSEILQLEENFDEEELLSILSFYIDMETILRLCAEFIKEINSIEQFIFEVELNKDELIECQNIILHEKRKIEILKKVLKTNELESNKKVVEKNEIILVPNNNEKIRIISDLEGIASDYYPTFKELINSAIDGTFKGVKVFRNNNLLASICELRKYKCRILFKRLSGRKYALIDAFIKKTTIDRGYLDFLKVKVSSYWEIHPRLKELINDEEFMKENEKNIEKLFQLLAIDEKNEEKDDTKELKKVKK